MPKVNKRYGYVNGRPLCVCGRGQCVKNSNRCKCCRAEAVKSQKNYAEQALKVKRDQIEEAKRLVNTQNSIKEQNSKLDDELKAVISNLDPSEAKKLSFYDDLKEDPNFDDLVDNIEEAEASEEEEEKEAEEAEEAEEDPEEDDVEVFETEEQQQSRSRRSMIRGKKIKKTRPWKRTGRNRIRFGNKPIDAFDTLKEKGEKDGAEKSNEKGNKDEAEKSKEKGEDNSAIVSSNSMNMSNLKEALPPSN